MTTEQYEKAQGTYASIKDLRRAISSLMNESDAIQVYIHPIEDAVISKDVETYCLINKAAIKAELIDILKDHIAKLEDQLKEI